MKDKGFTLIEMLIIVGLIAIIVTVAGASIVNVVQRGSDQSAEMMEKNLKDAALTYGVSKIFLKKCTPGFEPSESSLSDPNDSSNSCTKSVKVSYLINNGYFEDDGERCNKEVDIILYNYVEPGNSEDAITEYRAYIPANTCNP